MSKRTRSTRASPASPPPPTVTTGLPGFKQLWMRILLAPDGFAAYLEVNAVLRKGEMIEAPRAKKIAREWIAGLRDYLPRAEAMRDTVRVVEGLRDAVEVASTTLARTDEVLLADPERFLTPEHELAHRASRTGRQIAVERSIWTEEDFAAVAPESYERARQEMRRLGRAVPEQEGQDPVPMCLLRLRQALATVEQYLRVMAPATDLLKRLLDFGLLPYPSGGRPALVLAMFIAWLLQDTGRRGVPDHHVVAFLEDACADLPPRSPNLVPSVRSVAEWRRERETIPGICPRRDRSRKPK